MKSETVICFFLGGFFVGIHEVKIDFFLGLVLRALDDFLDDALHGISTSLVLPKKSLVPLLIFCMVEGPRDLLLLAPQLGMENLGRPLDFDLSEILALARSELVAVFLNGFRLGTFQPSASTVVAVKVKAARHKM